MLLFIVYYHYLLYSLLSLLLLVSASNNTTNHQANSTTEISSNADDKQAAFKLDCQPGEQRQFAYESSTKVWGSPEQQVRLRATLRLKCMEAPTNTTLKYLAEIIKLTPSFVSSGEQQDGAAAGPVASTAAKARKVAAAKQILEAANHQNSQLYKSPSPRSQIYTKQQAALHQQHQILESDVDQVLRAEPLLEEVSEVATRMKRSVSGWFSKAWVSVKDFFGNIFTSSERSSVSRDQVFKESGGLDIMPGQCKASAHKNNGGKTTGGLPFDESVFEDLGPEYYVGASLDGTSSYDFSSAGHVSTFGSEDRSHFAVEDAGDDSMSLSFFDDPPQLTSKTRRSKRATSSRGGKSKAQEDSENHDGADDPQRHLRLPFVFLQSRTGKIVEIRFASDESDLSVKNFKRHLCDLFATNLDWNKTTQTEVTPLGKHATNYTLDASVNSMDALKKSILKDVPNESSLRPNGADHEERTNKQQLVRVLATIGGGDRRVFSLEKTQPGNATTTSIQDDDADDDESQHTQKSSLSILRSINTTSGLQLVSKMHQHASSTSGGIDSMQVRIKQVQQISDGRLVGTAGQLSMSLIQQAAAQAGVSGRSKRAAPDDELPQVESDQNQLDISDLLRVSTSFSMQLVPIPRNPDGSADDDDQQSRAKRDVKAAPKNRTKNQRRAAAVVKSAPADPQELQRVLQDWRKREARLQLSSTSLISESAGPEESRATRLEVLRDQINQRLNEEFVRNRIRRSLKDQQVAAALASSSARSRDAENNNKPKPPALTTSGDLGLGLTQLVLGTGVTTRRKGSIHSTIEEVMQLERELADDQGERAISRLMRDTLKMDKLREHCKSSIPSVDELSGASLQGYTEFTESSAPDLEREKRLPFGLKEEARGAAQGTSEELRAARRARQVVSKFVARNDRKLEQCTRMLKLALQLNERRAIELALELLDECNQRLLAAARQEELGFGPMSKYYRRQRRLFTEALAHVSRTSDSLLDKLLSRLYHYPKLQQAPPPPQIQKSSARQAPAEPPPEFVYVNTRQLETTTTRYNKSLLKEEDDFNNNDGAAQLVMTLTSLAARGDSISRLKRLEVAEKLLGSLKGTSCSLFSSPDLDILESMANFQEPLDEIVGRILQLSRKCRAYDQYVVACVHALSGQLGHAATQRFLIEQLKSPTSSCTIKSEIVLTLAGQQLVSDLERQQRTGVTKQVQVSAEHQKLQETLLEILESKDKEREPDRRCLGQLIEHYLSSFGEKNPLAKRATASNTSSSRSSRSQPQTSTPKRRARSLTLTKRAVMNEQNFWDDAQCKKWTMPLDSSFYSLAPASATTCDLIDEIDDSSILTALSAINNNTNSRQGKRRQQKLVIERELETAAATNSSTAPSQQQQQVVPSATPAGAATSSLMTRRRHKCVASKEFGPRNAQATLKAEIVNDLIGARDENKFLARFRLSTHFLGNQIDVGRMYLWHQRRTTRAYANILGRSIWDTSHGCKDKAPSQLLYMPLFDFNIWLVKVSLGLRLHAEMGFFSNCDPASSGEGVAPLAPPVSVNSNSTTTGGTARYFQSGASSSLQDELQLFPTISLRAAGEATAKLVVARAGMALASQYSYQGDIRVSRQPESCMSISSAHAPMNITFSSWFQLWDNDCHFWGSRNRAEPSAIKWRLTGRKPIAWLADECLGGGPGLINGNRSFSSVSGGDGETLLRAKMTSGEASDQKLASSPAFTISP